MIKKEVLKNNLSNKVNNSKFIGFSEKILKFGIRKEVIGNINKYVLYSFILPDGFTIPITRFKVQK